jgi:hypothetical protein
VLPTIGNPRNDCPGVEPPLTSLVMRHVTSRLPSQLSVAHENIGYHDEPPRCVAAHSGRDLHAGRAVAKFRDKFWRILALTVPVVFWSGDVQHWLGYNAPTCTGSQLIPTILGKNTSRSTSESAVSDQKRRNVHHHCFKGHIHVAICSVGIATRRFPVGTCSESQPGNTAQHHTALQLSRWNLIWTGSC